MGSFSIWHWLIVLAVVLVLFGGGGKIPKLMRDMGQGINAFKRGLKEEDKEKAAESEAKRSIEQEPVAATAGAPKEQDRAASG
jgi:sec-independent protein translocase protein TatA